MRKTQNPATILFFLAGLLSVSAQVFTGTNAPGSATNIPVTVAAGTTNLSLTVAGNASAYSYVLVRRGSPPTDVSYDFSSQVNGQTNAVHLEQPEVAPGAYYVRVLTPASSSSHAFTLLMETNCIDSRTAARPVSKPLTTQAMGRAMNGTFQYFRVELPTNMAWRIQLDSTNLAAPDLYVQRGQLPTGGAFLKRSVGFTNDVVVFNTSEGTPGVYSIGVYASGGPAGGVPYTLDVSPVIPQTLVWDPGTTHLGTQVYSNTSGIAGDYYFRITTANPSLGAWRTALRVIGSNDANLYLSRGVLPTINVSDFKSERAGSDGVVLGLTSQFLPSEEWYLLVRARTASQWTLVSGAPFVADLGTVPTDGSSGSGDVEVGPEGLRFFSATAPANMLAWRLWLNGLSNSIYVKRTSLPLPLVSPLSFELTQPGQMLVVPSYLTVGQYFIGVSGTPGTFINLDSRQQAITDLGYGANVTANVTGFGYTTYRVQVPPNQIAWQLDLPSTNGNPNLAVRRNTVPNENYNDALSELVGSTTDNLALVPPILSDGTFYITVYGSGAHHFTLRNGPAVVTDINYVSTTLNDDPTRVGWRYYRVTDINQQLGSLGWDLLLTNFMPGTRIAVRRNAAPSLWNYRNPTQLPANYYDFLSTAEFLQRPANPYDVWYIGVYNPTNALGPFTLVTQELQAMPLADNAPLFRSNVLAGRWDFFRVQLTQQDLQGGAGLGPVLGWDLRLSNVTSGSPKLVVRREGFPTNLTTTINALGSTWPSGGQWVAGADWTRRSFSAEGTNEDGRILAMGVGRPWEPGTYYIGVLNGSGTNNMTYTLLSRWIGEGRAIPVQDLSWNQGSVTNVITPREAAYYRITLPPLAPSWKVRLSSTNGEAMLVVVTNRLPTVDSDKRVQKAGKEHYVMLPAPGSDYLVSGTAYLTVIGEGINPPSSTQVGTGPTTYVLESLGPMPEVDLGILTSTDLVINDAVEGGESKAYHFQTLPSAMGFWMFLENRVGNPWAVARSWIDLADPGLGGDLYGNEGGEIQGAVASSYMIVAANPAPDETIMIKGRSLGGTSYPDASYTLRIREIIPDPLPFDGGTFQIVDQPANLGSYFYIDVPAGALGWDLRVTNVTAGSPQIIVMRDYLPIILNTAGFNPYASSDWPSGGRWLAGTDWTERPYSAFGDYESGRVLAMGMGRPLQPGRYYIGVVSFSGSGTFSCTLVSRGIGPGLSIPVNDLNFAGGQVSAGGLPPREAAYYRVVIPSNSPSWSVQLTATNGESLLIASKDALPNVGAIANYSLYSINSGRKMQKAGDEQFLLLPAPGQSNLTAGTYYLTVVSEGQSPPSASSVGDGVSGYTLTSLGPAPVRSLGQVGQNDLLATNILAGGEAQIFQFTVPPGLQTVEARLENRTGNPMMVLRGGPRVPDAGIGGASIPPDPYGTDGGENSNNDVHATLINVPNPTNTVYTVVVKARVVSGFTTPTNATCVLRINASGTLPVEFDGGAAAIVNQLPATWRYFRIVVPTNALGWDVRLIGVTSGLPRLVVRRETLPNSLLTTPWGAPGTSPNWPTNSQWAPTTDWTKRSFSVDGLTIEDGRVLAMGLNRPLEPGLYYVGVMNSAPSTNMSYTLLSRGIGPSFSVPMVDLPFIGSLTNLSLPARDASYFRVVVPSNTPSWKLKVSGVVGESMFVALRSLVPNIDTVNAAGTLVNGKSMQKLGNEHFVMLPVTGQTNIQAGTNYLTVVSEGVNPGTTGRIGPGNSSFVLSSLGILPVTDLGLLTSEDIVHPDALEGGEVKAYRFTVPSGMYGLKVRLENRVNNPMAVVLPGDRLPDPSVGIGTIPVDNYGTEGGYAATEGHTTIVTLPNPAPGNFSLMVKARQVGTSYPDASYTLRLQEVLVPELNFSSDLNTNGLSNEASGLLEDNERAFFKVIIPATHNGQPVIGWKLDLTQSSGLASMRVRRDSLPSDANAGAQMSFTGASAIIAPPYLTNGVWFVEVKATGSTVFTLKSNPLSLERPAWIMPAPGETNQTPGLTLPMFGDTGIATNGSPLPGDQSIFLEQGFLHYYAVKVPGTNLGLLRAQLEAISGNPDLYLRVGAVPTLYHNISGAAGTLYDRSMLAAAGTEYANWVPLDGKTEMQLKPGFWYLAVRAAGNANARYRLRVSVGNITDLSIHSAGVTGQIVVGGDWRYYRVVLPATLPLGFNVTFSQESGDVVMYLRDTVPPGNGVTGTDYKDWNTDVKNYGPYPNYDPPNTYSFSAPPVRPGQMLFLGFRAVGDASFSVRITTNGAPAQEPIVVPFYGGMATTNVAPYSQVIFRVDVPPEATRWKHSSIHATNLLMFLDQGTIPTRTNNRWVSSGANSTHNTLLVTWNDILKQYVPANWPWVPGQSYFIVATNVTGTPQDVTFMMDGKNSTTDDSDTDGLADYWEYYYFSNLAQIANGDPDRDNVTNLDEFLDGTNPSDPTSYRARLTITAVNGTVRRQPDLASYPLGSTVILTPEPANGYAFIGWAGQASGMDNPLALVMDSAKMITARFKLAGDDFITALPLVGAATTVNGSNVSMTKEPGEPNHAGNPGGKSIWWRWNAPASGPTTLSTAGTPFNTLLAVYTGSVVSNLTLIASDNNSTGGTNRSRVTFNATAGVTYNIAVDGFNGASSRIILTLSSASVPAAIQLTALVRFPDGTMQVVLTGEPNRSYTIEYSDDLVSWNPLSTQTTLGDGAVIFVDPTATNASHRFYRARAQ